MRKIFLLLSLVVIFISTHAQVFPPNDNPCGAILKPVFAADVLSAECLPVIHPDYYIQYTNATLTAGIPNPSCVAGNPQNIRDVWVRCNVPASGHLNIRIAFGSSDLVLTAYSKVGSCTVGTYTEIGCNNDYLDTNPRLQLSGLVPLSEVFLRIFNNPSSVVTNGYFYVCLSDYYDNLPIVDNSTKVGIGATTAFAKLDVAGTGIFRDKTFFAKDIEVRENIVAKGRIKVSGLFFADSVTLAGGGFPGEFLTTDVNFNTVWRPLPTSAIVWSSAGANINNSNTGNIGVGISNPTYKLHLGNTNNGLRIEGPASASSGGSALNIGGFGDVIIDKPGVVAGRLSIKENGDVGFGSATPSAYGHGGTNRILELKNYESVGSNIQSHLILSSTGNAGSMGGVTWASTSLTGEQRTGYIGTAFETPTADQTRISFYTRSNTGVLAERFYVQGNGNAWLQGTLTQNSDIRLKKNIVPLILSLNKLTQLNGYTYNWISKDKDPNQQIGLIAQEVQKLYPQLVSEIKKENGETSLAVNYIGLIPVMIESIKELKKDTEVQQKQIDELKLLVQKLLNK
jgi:Chaperone of endosialidase